MAQILENENVKLFVDTVGNKENEPILMIAGAMAPYVFWNQQFCERLAINGYFVIRFDNRDIGRSTHFPQSKPDSGKDLPYTIDDMIEDARIVLQNFTYKPAHIIGHSLGASIAQLFAISYPEKIRTLTLISGPILAKGSLPYIETDPEITESLWKVLMGNKMYQDFERGLVEFEKVWTVLNGGWELDRKLAQEYTKSLYETEIIGPAWNHTNVQVGVRDIFDDLAKIKIPILFIHGENDYLPTHPENTRLLAETLPSAKFYPLERAGHMYFHKKLWLKLGEAILKHIVPV